MQHSKAPLLSCFLCELSRPLHIYSSVAQHSLLSPLTLRQMSPSSQACISRAKHKAFRSLTSCAYTQTRARAHTQGQSVKQREAEDNISIPSFMLALRGGRGGRPPLPLDSASLLYWSAEPKVKVTQGSYSKQPLPTQTPTYYKCYSYAVIWLFLSFLG